MERPHFDIVASGQRMRDIRKYNVSPMELLVEEDSSSSFCRLWRKGKLL